MKKKYIRFDNFANEIFLPYMYACVCVHFNFVRKKNWFNFIFSWDKCSNKFV